MYFKYMHAHKLDRNITCTCEFVKFLICVMQKALYDINTLYLHLLYMYDMVAVINFVYAICTCISIAAGLLCTKRV